MTKKKKKKKKTRNNERLSCEAMDYIYAERRFSMSPRRFIIYS